MVLFSCEQLFVGSITLPRQILLQFFDVFRAPHEARRFLMYSFWCHVQKVAGSTINGFAACTGHNERHWGGFVQELQIAIWVVNGVTRVRKQTACDIIIGSATLRKSFMS
jgi:hypothetical protein